MILLFAAGIGWWLLNWLDEDEPGQRAVSVRSPDYYMEHFSTLAMKQDGTPKNKLYADHMVHYSDGATELLRPRIEFFEENRRASSISADEGRLMSGSEMIVLRGNVRLKKYNDAKGPELEIMTADARVFVDQEYVETDNEATLISERSIVDSIGMRVWFQEEKLEFIHHVHTAIVPKRAN